MYIGGWVIIHNMYLMLINALLNAYFNYFTLAQVLEVVVAVHQEAVVGALEALVEAQEDQEALQEEAAEAEVVAVEVAVAVAVEEVSVLD